MSIEMIFLGFADAINFLQPAQVTELLPVNVPLFVIVGIILIVATIFILFFLKKFIMNTVLGAIIWFIAIYIFQVQLPYIPSLVVSLVIGPAGIGTMLLLHAFGII